MHCEIFRSSENMHLKSNKDGSYIATWVPSTRGSYVIQVFIDGREAGNTRVYSIHSMV